MCQNIHDVMYVYIVLASHPLPTMCQNIHDVMYVYIVLASHPLLYYVPKHP